ncbi:hypothetical protein CORI_1664 [Campylobacter sp. CCUG 57310]|nr:hypothetical protein CORI_1664 [Campylobacter sp. CCUG 57310]
MRLGLNRLLDVKLSYVLAVAPQLLALYVRDERDKIALIGELKMNLKIQKTKNKTEFINFESLR